MKKNNFFVLVLFMLSNLCPAQNEFYNAGCLIYIDSIGTNLNNVYNSAIKPSLFVGGSLTNGISGANIGTITNKGEIQISADWTQNDNATYNSSGDEIFLGANSGTINSTNNKYLQRISGNTSTAFSGSTKDFNNLIIAKPTRTALNESVIELGVNVEVDKNINWVGSGGVIRTDIITRNDAGESYLYEIYLKNPVPSSLSGFNTALGSGDKYIEGKLRRQVNTASVYRFPIGVDPFHSIGGLNALELTFSSNPTNAGLLTYLEKSNLVAMGNSGHAYCDVGKDPTSGGAQPFNLCSAGPDGIMDLLKCTKNQAYQWSVTSNTVGTFNYAIEVFPTANCELSAAGDLVPAACSAPYSGYIMEWLAHNGVPLGTATTITPGYFSQAGYNICPQLSTAYKKIFSQTGFSKFRLHGTIISETVLPIELISFNAFPLGDNNKIEWETSSEIKTDWHLIERSYNDPFNFVEIGKLKAAGFSDQKKQYTLLDNRPSNIAYYRLKTIDNDLSFQYSKIIKVERDLEDKILGIYPNPTSNLLNISFHSNDDKSYKFDVFNIVGQNLFTEEIIAKSGYNDKTIDLSMLPTAMYFVIINDGKNELTTKIIKK